MTLAFVTMVWRDHWLLRKWIAHNEGIVARSNLYVLNHGGDPEVAAIAAGCNIINIPRQAPTMDLTRRRWDLLGHFASGLLAFHEQVIVSDVDELLLYCGPAPSLADHLAKKETDHTAVGAIGLNLLPHVQCSDTDTMLQQFPQALVSAKYSKPCIARRPLRYTLGGHGLVNGSFRVDPALLLCHLHFVTPDYDARVQARKAIVAQSRAQHEQDDGGSSRPAGFWSNWSSPERIHDQLLERAARAEEIALPDGLAGIADRLNRAYRQKARRVMIDPKLDDTRPMRVTLPASMRSAF